MPTDSDKLIVARTIPYSEAEKRELHRLIDEKIAETERQDAEAVARYGKNNHDVPPKTSPYSAAEKKEMYQFIDKRMAEAAQQDAEAVARYGKPNSPDFFQKKDGTNGLAAKDVKASDGPAPSGNTT